MSLAYRGILSGMGMAYEGATWSTLTARTDWQELISASFQRKPDRRFRPHLVSGSRYVGKSTFMAADNSGGDMEHEGIYNSVVAGHVLWAALGGAASTGPSGTEYEHTFTPAITLPSFSMEFLRGTGTAEVFQGMKCGSLTLAQAPGDILRMKSSWMGEKSAGRAAQGTPTYTSAQKPVLYNQLGSFSWNSGSYAKIMSAEVTLDNKLERRQYCSSEFTTEPDFSGFREVTIKLGLHWDSDAFHSGLIAGTQSNAVLTWTGTDDDDLIVTAHNAEVWECTDPISGPGVVSQSVVLRGVADASNHGLSIVLRNSVAGSSYDW